MYGTLNELFALVWKLWNWFMKLFVWTHGIWRIFVLAYWLRGLVTWTNGLRRFLIRTQTNLAEINFLFKHFFILKRFKQMKIGLNIFLIIRIKSKSFLVLGINMTQVHRMWGNIMPLISHFRTTGQNMLSVKINLLIVELINVWWYWAKIIVGGFDWVCGWC